MDANVEQELFIEDLLNQINLDIYFPKFNNDLLKALIMNMFRDSPEIVDVLKQCSQMLLFSGSVVEGALAIRNINPNFPRNAIEAEVDIMLPIARVLKYKSKDVIVDLEYAKGFTWAKYGPDFVEWKPSKQPEEFLVEYLDGNTYINSNTAKAKLH